MESAGTIPLPAALPFRFTTSRASIVPHAGFAVVQDDKWSLMGTDKTSKKQPSVWTAGVLELREKKNLYASIPTWHTLPTK
jgi:hypothetical protein